MQLKIFKWNELNTEQRADLAMGMNLFAICFCAALTLYVFANTFASGWLLIGSGIIFVAGIVITKRFLKKAGGMKIVEDVPKQIKKELDERLEKNIERKAKKKSILGLDEECEDWAEEQLKKAKEELREEPEKPLVETETERVDKIREDFED